MTFRFNHWWTRIALAGAGVLLFALIVQAALTRIVGPTVVHNEPKLFVGLGGAFDSVNNVHLVVWGTQNPGPANGLFLNADGLPLGGPFPISSGPEQAGWASVVYSPEQQRFLVSYTKILGPSSHQRAFKLLTYNGAGGANFLTGETILAGFARGFGDPPGVAYSPGAGVFLATWHHDDLTSPSFGDRRPRSYVAPITPAGVILGVQELTNPDDGQSDPQIACNASGRCLVVGFAWGQFAGAVASMWGRYIDGAGATPLGTSSFYIATAPAQFEPTVVYSPGSGQWLAAFTRDLKSVWGRMLDVNGGMGPIFLIKASAGESSPDGGGFGLPALSNNPATSTLMMAMGSWAGLACTQELDAFGGLLGATDCVPGTIGATQYTGSIADPNSSRYLLIDNQQYNKIRSTAYSVGGGGPVGQPPVVTGHPQSHTIPGGAATALSVTATGTAPLAYQWYEGFSPSTAVPIPGATGNTYNTPGLGSTKRYWVSVSNAHGSANSATATVSVTHVTNGGFWLGSANWGTFATPDQSYIQNSVVNGVMHFYKVPPGAGVNQATVFQQTGTAIGAGMGIKAQFMLGNSSTVRKRVSVLLTDADFSDLAVCTFWLPANTPLQGYSMQTHATETWSNASIYFYAASPGSDGGFYLLDDVILEQDSTLSTTRTDCFEPTVPAASGLPNGPNLIANGTFDTNAAAPWIAFGSLAYQIPAGVVEMLQPPGPPGAFLQPTGIPLAGNQILTAGFKLGNSSGVKKRVTVIMHDVDFSDMAACTFWLQPGAGLSDYAMVTKTTEAWSNATLSFYVATQGFDPWVRLDNVYLMQTPSIATTGTNCMEPGTWTSAAGGPSARAKRGVSAPSTGAPSGGNVSPPQARAANRSSGSFASELVADLVDPAIDQRMDMIQTFDLRTASTASLTFESSLSSGASVAEVQISEDAGAWQTIMLVPPSEDWIPLSIDLSPWSGRVVHVKFAFRGAASRFGRPPDTWKIGDVRVSR